MKKTCPAARAVRYVPAGLEAARRSRRERSLERTLETLAHAALGRCFSVISGSLFLRS